MIKKYSFPTEVKAKELIALLSDEPNPTVTETTHGIVILGFQDKYDIEGNLIEKGLSYDVDIFWKDLPNEDWTEYEVNPATPNHKFA